MRYYGAMEANWLYDTLYNLSHYAPIVILIAAALDIFFVTGLFLYGFAMLSTVGMLHATGMISTQALIVSAFIGTVSGNICNYWAGRLFNNTRFIQSKLESKQAKRAQSFLNSRSLFLYMIVGRFITFTRPLYALLLGSLQVSFRTFLSREIPLALFWVTFWIVIILQGERLYELIT